MKAFLLLLIIVISQNVLAQKIHYVDFPKVDGEFDVSPTRKTKTNIPKPKCTSLLSFGYSNSKSIYFNSDVVVQNKAKANEFQEFQFELTIDKSIKEWHSRMFAGLRIPSLDFFTDNTIGSQSEISHIKLTNVRLTSINCIGNVNGKPIYRITANYEKLNYAASEWNLDGTIKAISQSCFDLKMAFHAPKHYRHEKNIISNYFFYFLSWIFSEILLEIYKSKYYRSFHFASGTRLF